MKKVCAVFVSGLLLYGLPARAQVEDAPHEISVYASACEKLINGESKASARVRATDKASFKAVEEIPELRRFRDQTDTHNFNLKVYRLVDNYLADLQINASSPEDDKVCVELSAYLPAAAIDEVFAEETEDSSTTGDDETLALELETADAGDNISITIPPKPDITINKQIAYEDTAAAAPVVKIKETPLDDVSETPSETDEPSAEAERNKDTRVFVAPTEFYNGTSTGGFFAQLEQTLAARPGVKVIARGDNPDYILKTKILKAKVDNINSETRRLQIVVALELTDTASSQTTTEHQNRFILFNASDDAQQVAADLTRKLLAAGLDKLLPEIKTGRHESVITPNRPRSRPRPDAA